MREMSIFLLLLFVIRHTWEMRGAVHIGIHEVEVGTTCRTWSYLRSSTWPLTSFFWLLSHVIDLKLTKVLWECLLIQSWVMGSRTSFSVSQQLKPELSAKQMLSILSELGRKTLLWYFCQLEIDHVTQQPNETCQRTCRWPESLNIWFFFCCFSY